MKELNYPHRLSIRSIKDGVLYATICELKRITKKNPLSKLLYYVGYNYWIPPKTIGQIIETGILEHVPYRLSPVKPMNKEAELFKDGFIHKAKEIIERYSEEKDAMYTYGKPWFNACEWENIHSWLTPKAKGDFFIMGKMYAEKFKEEISMNF